MSQTDLGRMFGVARGAIARWERGGIARFTPEQARILARAVAPTDAVLASEIAASTGMTIEALGIAMPSKSMSDRGFVHRLLADAIVCAAAEVLGQPPAAVRPGLLAAFERAVAANMSAADVAKALATASKPA